MFIISNITNNPKQKQNLKLQDGTIVKISIEFISMQYGWFIRSLEYEDFLLYNLRISNSPNFLRQFKNQIPFGMACFSTGDREPSLIDDFSSKASKLYILSAEEVTAYEEYLSG